MRQCMDSIAGITWERLERESSVTYPCEKEGDPGQPVVFVQNFPTPTGRGRFVPADLISAAERPDGSASATSRFSPSQALASYAWTPSSHWSR